MNEQVAPQPRSDGRAWVCAVLGIVAIAQFPLLLVLITLEPSSGFPEPLHTLTHEGALVFLLAGLLLGAAALVLAVLTLRRGRTSRLGLGLTITGLRTAVPAVGALIYLLGHL
jgi:hypothetical protein